MQNSYGYLKSALKKCSFHNNQQCSRFSRIQKTVKILDTTICFTYSYCSWEKGQIEYCNKLLKQYIHKHGIINKLNTLILKAYTKIN